MVFEDVIFVLLINKVRFELTSVQHNSCIDATRRYELPPIVILLAFSQLILETMPKSGPVDGIKSRHELNYSKHLQERRLLSGIQPGKSLRIDDSKVGFANGNSGSHLMPFLRVRKYLVRKHQ